MRRFSLYNKGTAGIRLQPQGEGFFALNDFIFFQKLFDIRTLDFIQGHG